MATEEPPATPSLSRLPRGGPRPFIISEGGRSERKCLPNSGRLFPLPDGDPDPELRGLEEEGGGGSPHDAVRVEIPSKAGSYSAVRVCESVTS